ASFYVLTPIPGTSQYGDFKHEGLLVEPNMDHYDTSCLVWRHPHLSPDELSRLLFECYREFYGFRDAFKKAVRRHGINPGGVVASLTTAAFNWTSGALERHPMSGGIGLRRRDHVQNFLPYRRDVFGDVLENNLVPLPDNL
ncbi:MAG: hypothetical protein HYU35_01330, partial [Parcubacteria group bacterium]|nr:hypothetical protein [Parcubacteria group bacterium]